MLPGVTLLHGPFLKFKLIISPYVLQVQGGPFFLVPKGEKFALRGLELGGRIKCRSMKASAYMFQSVIL